MSVRTRFVIAAGAALAVSLMAVGTFLRPDWIEGTVGFDPDGGNGSVEWITVATLLLVVVVCMRWFARAANRSSGYAMVPGVTRAKAGPPRRALDVN